MSKLSEYGNFSEKTKYFKHGEFRVTKNIEGIFEKLEECLSTGDFVFRGCPEAKYKLYNSAQRHYNNHELFRQVPEKEMSEHYNLFISNLINECRNWNSQTVKKIFSANKVNEENSLAYLSYMQHFGVPTPLLDFTYDPYIALFFAIDNNNFKPCDIEIDNYFSIYYTYQNATIFESWKDVFKNQIPSLNSGVIPYSDVNKNEMSILLPDNEAYQIINNTNIINQKGLFFYNNDPIKPLEEKYLDFALLVKSYLGETKFKDSMMQEKFVNCININKSLIPYIKNVLISKGITNDLIYPDINKMKNTILNNATNKLIISKS